MLKLCKSCRHLIHDDTWGEYKCTKYHIRLYNANKIFSCKGYSKKDKER